MSRSLKTQKEKQSGFTLVAVIIGIVVIALLLLAYLQAAGLLVRQKNMDDSRDAIRLVQQAMQQFYAENGFFPCPAPRGLGSGDEDSGLPQDCDFDLIAEQDSLPDGLILIDNATPANTNDDVIVGTVPYKELRLEFENTLDGYNNQLTYAITRQMAILPPAPQDYIENDPAVESDDREGEVRLQTIEQNGSIEEDNVFFLVFSHGPTGAGSITAAGGPHGNACPDSGPEAENCSFTNTTFVSQGFSTAQNDEFFDDILIIPGDITESETIPGGEGTEIEDYWVVSGSGDVDIESEMQPGNVGIGTGESPLPHKLTVTGNTQIRGSLNFQAEEEENNTQLNYNQTGQYLRLSQSEKSFYFKDGRLYVGTLPETEEETPNMLTVSGKSRIKSGNMQIRQGPLTSDKTVVTVPNSGSAARGLEVEGWVNVMNRMRVGSLIADENDPQEVALQVDGTLKLGMDDLDSYSNFDPDYTPGGYDSYCYGPGPNPSICVNLGPCYDKRKGVVVFGRRFPAEYGVETTNEPFVCVQVGNNDYSTFEWQKSYCDEHAN